MTVLVIGGTGVVGPAVVSALQGQAHRVVVLHRGNTVAGMDDGVEIDICDRTRPRALQSALERWRPAATVDLACYTPDDASAICRLLPPGHRYLFVSTVSVHGGPQPVPIHEGLTPTPLSPYALGKVEAERAVVRHGTERGVRTTIVRLGACFREGAALDGQLFECPSWLRRLARGEPVALADGGSALANLLHTSDAGRAIAGLVGCDAAAGATVLVASQRARSWREHYGVIARALGLRLQCVDIDGEWLCREISDPTFLAEMSRWDQVYDLSRLRTLLPDFREETPLDEALARAASLLIQDADFGDPDLAEEEGRLIAEWHASVRGEPV